VVNSARLRRSRAVRLGALGALSLALAACSSPAGESSVPDSDYTGPPGGYAVTDGTSSPDSASVPAPAALAGGESSDYCVEDDGSGDGSYGIVDDGLCDDGYGNSHSGRYYRYYGGSPYGSRVSGGSTIRPPGSTSSRGGTTSGGSTSDGGTSHGVTRGGFGGHSGSSGG
jgi:hypothetical protein